MPYAPASRIATRSPSFTCGYFPIPGKKVSCLAHRTDDVHHSWWRRQVLRDRQDLVVGLVERGPDEVVHPRVSDYESLTPIALDHQNPGQQGPGLGDQEPARFEQEPNRKPLERPFDRGRVLCHFRSGIKVEAELR